MNKMNRRFTSLLFIAAMSTSLWAATKTVTLNVSGMTCSACPITIKKALNKVQGVSKVDVNYEKKQAVVTFDDTKTDPSNRNALLRRCLMDQRFDVVVIGSGTAGSTAASTCRSAGWSVAVVDSLPFGGTCALRGCDPKNVLVGAANWSTSPSA